MNDGSGRTVGFKPSGDLGGSVHIPGTKLRFSKQDQCSAIVGCGGKCTFEALLRSGGVVLRSGQGYCE
ncbi:MAG: hypothetical protein R2682_11115 [Pyrinomonadaceae bacterium]